MKPILLTHRYFKYAVMLLLSGLMACHYWGCARRPVSPAVTPVALEDRLYAEADTLLDAGDYDRALIRYRTYVAQYPHRSFADDALMKIASIHLVNGRYAQARDQYQRIFDEYPDSGSFSDAQVDFLATYYHEGAYSELFEKVRELDIETLPSPARMRLYNLMGDTYLSSGYVKEAVDAYALSLSCLSETERMETTPEMVRAIHALDPKDIVLLLDGPDYLPKAYLMYQLGISNMAAGWDQAAKDAFSAYLIRYPEHPYSEEARHFLEEIEKKTLFDRFSLGCLLPLSGTYSSYGKRALRGIELAYSKFRLNYPEIPVKLVIKDTGSDESQTIQAVRELDAAQVAAIIGPIVMAKPAAEEAQRIGIPIITFSQKDDIADIGGFVFRNFLTPRTQVNTIISYLAEDLELKKFAILYPDDKYGETFMNLFWDGVIDHGGTVVGCEPYMGKETHFADPIKKLVGLFYEMPDDLEAELLAGMQPLPDSVWRMLNPPAFQVEDSEYTPWPSGGVAEADTFFPNNMYHVTAMDETWDMLTGEGDYKVDEDEEPQAIVDFDAVFIPDSPKKAGLIASQLAYYDVENVLLIGTNLWHTDELIQMARRYVQNAILTDGFFAQSEALVVREFVRAFASIYKAEPQFIEAVAYDTAGILFTLVSRSDIFFRSSIRENLLNEPFFQGVTGDTKFLETGEPEKQIQLLKIKGRRFRAVSATQH